MNSPNLRCAMALVLVREARESAKLDAPQVVIAKLEQAEKELDLLALDVQQLARENAVLTVQVMSEADEARVRGEIGGQR